MQTENFKTITLTKDKVAIVDESDYARISIYNWVAKKHGRTFYATRGKLIDGKRVELKMHRLILNLPPEDGRIPDHINGNGLDNRKQNLRISSSVLNQYNTRRRIDNTSGFKGVQFHKPTSKWTAKIKINKVRHHLGYYTSAEEAARAYDRAAISLRGIENTVVNFPSSETKLKNKCPLCGHDLT
jgi:hypothetical protein